MSDSNQQFHLPFISATEALERAAQGAVLVDLRKPAARASNGRAVVGAELRNPFGFSHDDPLTEEARPIVTFCVHGHEVSQFGCAMLMLHGRDVVYVRGGFEALVAAGALLEDLAE